LTQPNDDVSLTLHASVRLTYEDDLNTFLKKTLHVKRVQEIG